MNICGTATVWAKIALLLMFIALGLHVAGFATMYWEQTETIQENTVYSVGLWKSVNCSGGHNSACNNFAVPSTYIKQSFKAVQAFECIVLILLTIIVIVAALYVASERFREMSIAIFVTVMCFLTVTFAVISMIIWLAQIPSNHYPGYSFGLCVFAFILLFLGGILMIPDIRRYQQRRGKDALKVRPDPRQTEIRRAPKYDELRNHDYSYNKKFAPQTPQSNVRHYYNPNRDPYVTSPPPAYKTSATPDYRDYRSSVGRDARTDIQTPDVYLGRDGRRPRRY